MEVLALMAVAEAARVSVAGSVPEAAVGSVPAAVLLEAEVPEVGTAQVVGQVPAAEAEVREVAPSVREALRLRGLPVVAAGVTVQTPVPAAPHPVKAAPEVASPPPPTSKSRWRGVRPMPVPM